MKIANNLTVVMTRVYVLLALLSGIIAFDPGTLAAQTPEGPTLLQSEPLQIEASDNEHRKLLKEQHNTALAILKLRFKDYQAGEVKVRAVLDSASQVIYSREAIAENAGQRIQIQEQYGELCKILEATARQRVEKKTGSEADWLEAKYYRLSAELERLQTRGIDGPSGPALPAPAEEDPAEDANMTLEKVITSQGGSFTRDGLPNAPIVEVSFVSSMETNATLKRLAEITTIRSLEMRSKYVTDEGLQHLQVQTNLESLVLNSPNITDAGMKGFQIFPRLKELSLGGTNITDSGLQEIGRLMQLEKLTLPGNNVTDDGLKYLANLRNLRELHANGSKVTNAGLKEIGKMKTLQELGLMSSFITDAGLKELHELSDLRTLHIGFTAVGDSGLKDLKTLNLQSLWLSHTLVTDAGLVELAQIKSLKDLQLIDTKVTEAGVSKFRDKLPRCSVTLKQNF